MTNADWIALFGPVVAGVVTVGAAALAAILTGLSAKLSAYLTAHQQAAAAQMLASANAVIQPALQTGASTLAARIATGKLDYTNKTALLSAAVAELAVIEPRVASSIAVAAPIAGALVASMIGKLDAMMVAKPLLPVPAPVQPAPAANYVTTSATPQTPFPTTKRP